MACLQFARRSDCHANKCGCIQTPLYSPPLHSSLSYVPSPPLNLSVPPPTLPSMWRPRCLQVFALSSLECFYEDEIETLLCGEGEHWTSQVRRD